MVAPDTKTLMASSTVHPGSLASDSWTTTMAPEVGLFSLVGTVKSHPTEAAAP